MMHPRICADADDGSSHVDVDALLPRPTCHLQYPLLHPSLPSTYPTRHTEPQDAARRGDVPIRSCAIAMPILCHSFPSLSHKSPARSSATTPPFPFSVRALSPPSC